MVLGYYIPVYTRRHARGGHETSDDGNSSYTTLGLRAELPTSPAGLHLGRTKRLRHSLDGELVSSDVHDRHTGYLPRSQQSHALPLTDHRKHTAAALRWTQQVRETNLSNPPLQVLITRRDNVTPVLNNKERREQRQLPTVIPFSVRGRRRALSGVSVTVQMHVRVCVCACICMHVQITVTTAWR